MFIIGSCSNLVESIYADGTKTCHECANSASDQKCYEVINCPFRNVAEKLLKVANEQQCNNCDGAGYDEGCADISCGTHAAWECLKVMEVKFLEK